MLPQNGSYLRGKEYCWLPGINFMQNKIAQETPGKNWTIADFGCGDGSFFHYFSKEAKNRNISLDSVNYLGLDSSSLYEEHVLHNGGRFFLGDVLNPPTILYQQADFIICSEIIEHLDETDILMDSIKKVLKSNGWLYLTTPNLASYHGRLCLLLGWQPFFTEVSNRSCTFGKGPIFTKFYAKGDPTAVHHLRAFTYKALLEFLRFHGWQVVETGGCGYTKFESRLWNYLPSLAPVNWIIACQVAG